MIFSMALESANRGLTPMRGQVRRAGPRRASVAPKNLFQTIRFVTPLISAAKSRSPVFEIARVLVRLNHIAHFVVNANHSAM